MKLEHFLTAQDLMHRLRYPCERGTMQRGGAKAAHQQRPFNPTVSGNTRPEHCSTSDVNKLLSTPARLLRTQSLWLKSPRLSQVNTESVRSLIDRWMALVET